MNHLKIFVLAGLVSVAQGAMAQQSNEKTLTVAKEGKNNEVFTYVEHMPKFKGSMPEYLGQNIHYPAAAREKGISGRVFLNFVVDEDGNISDVQVIRGIGGGCDEEAKRVVAGMPAWIPGSQNGRLVKVRFTLPIMFKLTDPDDKAGMHEGGK